VAGEVSRAVNLTFDPETLRPLIKAVVAEVVSQMESDKAKIDNGRLVFTEEEAAAMLQLQPHCLRDERRRGKIGCSRVVGRRLRYTKQDLLDYLRGRRIEAILRCLVEAGNH
jgi:hypothetical protein